LERKLAISQAYADALKQAHDKCTQEGSHVETSSESSVNYAQVSLFSDHLFLFFFEIYILIVM